MIDRIYYVKIVMGGDFDHIPISMFGQPALFKTIQGAEIFKSFSEGAGHKVEICEWPESEAT